MERLGKKVVCARCANTLRYGEGDVSEGVCGKLFIKCPVCGSPVSVPR